MIPMAAKKLKRVGKAGLETRARKPLAKSPSKPAKLVVDARNNCVPSTTLLPTGSTSLDKLLGGGIEDGSSILLLGTPHCGKKPVLMNLASAVRRKGKEPIFMLTDIGALSWRSMMKEGGWESDTNEGGTFFIDCYSRQFGSCSDSDTVTNLEVPFSPSTLSIEASNFIEKASAVSRLKPIVVFHSISTLYGLFGEEETYSFLKFFIGKMKANGITAVFSLQRGIHGLEIESAVSGLVDCVVEMNRYKMKASGYKRITAKGWVPYEMKDGKLKLTLT